MTDAHLVRVQSSVFPVDVDGRCTSCGADVSAKVLGMTAVTSALGVSVG